MNAPAQSAPAAPGKPPRRLPGALYSAIWRWHFWAGLLVAPVLVIVALTGALLAFHGEINGLLHPGLHRAGQGGGRLPFETRIAAARARLGGDDWRLLVMRESGDPAQVDEILLERETPAGLEQIIVTVDPCTAGVAGALSLNEGFMSAVLRLHRSLFAGAAGRALVELSTCWGVVTLLTGLLLWWPRLWEKTRGARLPRPASASAITGAIWEKTRGAWLPRLRNGAGPALRDLHVVPAVYMTPLVLVIMLAGLVHTPVFGRGFFAGLRLARQFPASRLSPPKSAPPAPGARPLTADEAVAAARKHFDFGGLSLSPPPRPGAAWTISSPLDKPLQPGAIVFIDARTGAALDIIRLRDMPPGARLALWFYPVHTGSVFGLPTKILAVLACLSVALMSLTGVMLWWRRRPRGKFGSPGVGPGAPPVPKAAICALALLGVIFPLVGASLLLLPAGEFATRRLRRAWRKGDANQK
ncbi:MAG: PepSY domain-containing protein [Opitutaceae bacterium]|jgi:uncharacterized iron-regulated membrane protein|nr:PepSY domain-containing protein [Opitutaceae bacterium]